MSARLSISTRLVAALAVCAGLGAADITPAAAAGAYGPDTCRQGYVWRESFPGDTVCVTPAERARAKRANETAGYRVKPGGGVYGPKTCRNGYVWREAFDGDTVCVTPAERARVKADNGVARYRYENSY
jgi:hypothetical protein